MRRLRSLVVLVAFSLAPAAAVAQERRAPGPEAEGGYVPPRVVELLVTERGLFPSVIKVGLDEVVELRITRENDRACAEFAIPMEDTRLALPAGTAVTHRFRGHQRGRVAFGCTVTGYFRVE
jgi:hypothetical protein